MAMRPRVVTVLLAGAALSGGCAPTVTPSETASQPEPLPSDTPSASAPGSGSVSVDILGDAPVLTGEDVNDDWVLPAALTWADGTYHLWGVAFDQETTENHGYYATSPDGMAWTVAAEDPLDSIGLDLGDPGPIPGSVLPEADGTWVMYLWGVPGPGQRDSVLFRATAAASGGPFTADPEPILTGTPGAWDATYLDFPSVVATDDGYLMLYGGGSLGAPDSSSIGLATSTDGVTWTKVPVPVLEPGLCGSFDKRSVAIPRFRLTDPGFLVFYNGLGEDRDRPADVGAAVSSNGRAWTCASPTPALSAEEIPGSQGIHTIAVAATARGPEFIVESLGDASSTLWFGDVDMSDLR